MKNWLSKTNMEKTNIEKDILESNEGEFVDEVSVIEEEEMAQQIAEQQIKTVATKKTEKAKQVQEGSQVITNTFEAFIQPARFGIINNVTGEIIEGFDIEKDKAIVQLGTTMLNKLDKIAIASGI